MADGHSDFAPLADGHAEEDADKKAVLYRMVIDKHLCSNGIKSKWFLELHGFDVDDHHLTTRAETDAFKEKHGVETTPQTFIEGERIGGYDALRAFFSDTAKDADETTYVPVIVIFAMCALMTIGTNLAVGTLFSFRTVEWFAAFSMSVLAIQKLRDIESFSSGFLNYDLLAQRYVPYAYFYPFGEALAGVLMIAGGAFALAGAPIALFIGSIGAASVFKAVYIDKRELKCACVGGNSKVPLGFVSLTENLVMIALGLWMIVK